jgi:hypothetical protein
MELKAIDRSDRGRRRLQAALSLYTQLVSAEERNPEKQIIYWIDHSKDRLTDEFRCFAIQRDDEVIGYLQYSYFAEEHLFFFEYLCILDRRQKALVPHPAVRLIRDHLARNYEPDFTIVFDLAHTIDPAGQRVPDRKRLDYFERIGFRKVEFNYEFPELQSYSIAASHSADLLVQLPQGRTVATASELRTIIRCIYFKHYLRWDRPFLNEEEFAARQRLIDELYAKQLAQIVGKHGFPTIGSNRRNPLVTLIARYQPSIHELFQRVFTPKMPRLLAWLFILLICQWILGDVWRLIPLAFVLIIVDCLTQDTDASRKLLIAIVSRFRFAWRK